MSASIATTLPTPRALLPRTSSKTSGFFFCGIMLEPAAMAPSSFTSANSLVEKSTMSAAMRARARGRRAPRPTSSRGRSRGRRPCAARCASAPTGAKRRATSARSMGSDVPEQAPLPRGISRRSSAKTTVSAARARPMPHARDEEGGADGLGALAVRVRGQERVLLARRPDRRAMRRAARVARSSAAPRSRTWRRRSSATWSLRERAV